MSLRVAFDDADERVCCCTKNPALECVVFSLTNRFYLKKYKMGIICKGTDVFTWISYLAMKILGKIYVWEGTYLQNISDNIIFVYGNSRQST